jgi:hypothetical protein
MATQLDVAAIANLTLEGVEEEIPKLVITDDTLAGQFKNNKAKRVSNRLYRLVMQIALAGGDSRAVALDGGASAPGLGSQMAGRRRNPDRDFGCYQLDRTRSHGRRES